ncbi:MAG: AEC family transporter [Kistimonas sp.]|nr:AEC family transporter [Kistimonas sp.]
METTILAKSTFLIITTVIGWIAGRKLTIDSRGPSCLLIYVISPFVIFSSIAESPADFSFFRYTAAALVISSSLALISFLLAKLVWNDSKVHLFSFAGGTGNTGYFALPVVFSLFSPEIAAVAVFITLGVILYEFTVGYFITAMDKFDNKECLRKVLSLPVIPAAIIGLLVKYMGLELPAQLQSFFNSFKGAYSVLGMMVIGITLSQFSALKFDWKFSFFCIGWKQLIVPLFGTLLISQLGLTHDICLVASLMLATPMAANVVILANQLDVHPEIAASTVMLSTLLAIISVPLNMHVMLVLLQ